MSECQNLSERLTKTEKDYGIALTTMKENHEMEKSAMEEGFEKDVHNVLHK